MRFCGCEGRDFPEREFKKQDGVLMHVRPGRALHPAEAAVKPPPVTVRMMVRDKLLPSSADAILLEASLDRGGREDKKEEADD